MSFYTGINIRIYRESKAKQKEQLAFEYNMQGIQFSETRDWRQAVFYYTKAIEIKPDRCGFYANRAGAYAGINDHQHKAGGMIKA